MLDGGRRLERVLRADTLVEARKVNIPRYVDRLGIFFPMSIHLLDIVCVGSGRKRVIGRRRLGCRGRCEMTRAEVECWLAGGERAGNARGASSVEGQPTQHVDEEKRKV